MASTHRHPTDLSAILAALKPLASPKYRVDMFARYGITGPTADTALGVPMAKLQPLAKSLGKSHDLALALWEHRGPGSFECRMLAAFVDDPALVTSAQMDRWCKTFDNWGTCDTVCFKLFDRVDTDLAFRKVHQWSTSKHEFIKRAAFALLASLALHNKSATDDLFLAALPLCEPAAADDRNFVKKGVSWALRGTAKRNPRLRAAVLKLAGTLAESEQAAPRWIGKDVLRELGARSKSPPSKSPKASVKPKSKRARKR